YGGAKNVGGNHANMKTRIPRDNLRCAGRREGDGLDMRRGYIMTGAGTGSGMIIAVKAFRG
ncbi:MAG: hypothetical protein WCG36_04110, partial [bacterium]